MTLTALGLTISVLIALGGTYVAIRARALRIAMNGLDGGQLMAVLSRIIKVVVLAMWFGSLRLLLRVIDDQGRDTGVAQTLLSTVSSIMVLAVLAWALIRVRNFHEDS